MDETVPFEAGPHSFPHLQVSPGASHTLKPNVMGTDSSWNQWHVVTAGIWSIARYQDERTSPPGSSIRPSLPQSEKSPPEETLVLSKKWVFPNKNFQCRCVFPKFLLKNKTWSTWPLTNPSWFCMITWKSNRTKIDSLFYQLRKIISNEELPNTNGGNETLTTILQQNNWNAPLVCWFAALCLTTLQVQWVPRTVPLRSSSKVCTAEGSILKVSWKRPGTRDPFQKSGCYVIVGSFGRQTVQLKKKRTTITTTVTWLREISF